MTADNNTVREAEGTRGNTPASRLKIQWDATTLGDRTAMGGIAESVSEPLSRPSASGPGRHDASEPPTSDHSGSGDTVPLRHPQPSSEQPPTGRTKVHVRSVSAENNQDAGPPSRIDSTSSTALVADLQQIIHKLTLVTNALQSLDRVIHESLDLIEPESSGPKRYPPSDGEGFLVTDNRKELLELIARRINQ